ncbi:MAG: type II toxin-antitoxin system RelE/ParE family toxin [Myxococcaceae bacterium]|nr:type II toxin-antitoxin system RelE/ParE family toxin [Myxococcaceae bacterium]
MSARPSWTEVARLDLYDLCEYIAGDNLDAALKLADDIEKAVARLARTPNRGRYVPELENTPVAREYRELIVRHVRGVYRPMRGAVLVHGVFDSRRDLEETLTERLLRPPTR